MNIFYLDKDPAKAASYFYDKHKVKMILESAQMLCTAHHHMVTETMYLIKKHITIIRLPYGVGKTLVNTCGYMIT